MKKTMISFLLIGLLITGFAISNASAYGYGSSGGRGGKNVEAPCFYKKGSCDAYGYYHKGIGYGYQRSIKQVLRFQHENMLMRVAIQLTGKSESDIRTDVQNGSWKYVLEKHKISPEKFSAAMKKEVQAYVQNAVKSGSITEEQGNIALRMTEKGSTKS